MLDVLLVGCGKMGSALARRWRETKMCRRLVIVDPAASLASLITDEVPAFKSLPTGFTPQVIVLAVKPQTLSSTVHDYKTFSTQGALTLSIAAGKPVSFFETHLGASAKIVRTMPNLPAAVGKGMTVAYANPNVTDLEKDWASMLMDAVGRVLWVEKESLLNPVTALSGSGPAYVFLLIEALTKAGIHIGLEPGMAEKLARQTRRGGYVLAEQSPSVSAAALRESVTSPNGTTSAALEILMAEPAIQDLFNRALAAATKRAEELAK